MTTTMTGSPPLAIDVLSQMLPDDSSSATPAAPPAPALTATAPADGGGSATVTTLDPRTMTDELLLDYRAAIEDAREDLLLIIHRVDLEMERRMRERGAKVIAHPKYETVELVEQFTPYVTDNAKLQAAAKRLRELGKDEEAAKLGRIVPEHVTVVPKHFKAGETVSILAIGKKYGSTPGIGDELKGAITRKSLGERVSIKRKKEGAK